MAPTFTLDLQNSCHSTCPSTETARLRGNRGTDVWWRRIQWRCISFVAQRKGKSNGAGSLLNNLSRPSLSESPILFLLFFFSHKSRTFPSQRSGLVFFLPVPSTVPTAVFLPSECDVDPAQPSVSDLVPRAEFSSVEKVLMYGSVWGVCAIRMYFFFLIRVGGRADEQGVMMHGVSSLR